MGVSEYMGLAESMSKSSNCIREGRKVGAVIVVDNDVISAGYNSMPNGCNKCEDIGCMRFLYQIKSGEHQQMCRAVHAEQNALINALNRGVSVKGGTIYITHQPCVICAKMLINAGIERVVYKENYPDELAVMLLFEAGVVLTHYKE